MSEVHRYYIVKMLSEDGNRITYDPHGPEVVLASDYDALYRKERHYLNRCAALEVERGELREFADMLESKCNSLHEDNRHLHQVNLDWAERYIKLERDINDLQSENKQLKTLLNQKELPCT